VSDDQRELPLFASLYTKPRHRRHDPVASLVAAERAERFVSEHAAIVLKAIIDHAGATAKQLAAIPGMRLTYHQISRRTGELEERGYIVRTPHPTTSELTMIATTRATNYFGMPVPREGQWKEHDGRGERIVSERLT
jgi:DNA-binding MarR family transcriptional regulator